jgi:hypothetical protein
VLIAFADSKKNTLGILSLSEKKKEKHKDSGTRKKAKMKFNAFSALEQ